MRTPSVLITTLMLLSHGEIALAKMKYAACEVSEKDGVDEGLSGVMLFYQRKKRKMKTLGLFSKDLSKFEPNTECFTEVRGFDVTENASEDTCMDPGASWPFGARKKGKDDRALSDDLEFW